MLQRMIVGLLSRHRVRVSGLLAMLLILWSMFGLNAPAQSNNDAPPPLEGTVVKITQVGVDLFYHLDENNDGAGEVWVKVVGIILDLNNNEVAPSEIEVGMPLRVIDYLDNDVGFVEGFEIILLLELDRTEMETTRTGQATFVNVFARIPGSPRPTLDLFGTDQNAWICLGEDIELYWVTTADVTLISLGETLGTFRADLGGTINGLKWGSVIASPRDTTGYQISAIDGNFQSDNVALVSVYKTANELDSFETPEGSFVATLRGGAVVDSSSSDDWISEMPSTRFSAQLGILDIKPVGGATKANALWRIKNVASDGNTYNFTISSNEVFQHPFRPEGTTNSIPVSGTWTFSTPGDIPDKTITFTVKPICSS